MLIPERCSFTPAENYGTVENPTEPAGEETIALTVDAIENAET